MFLAPCKCWGEKHGPYPGKDYGVAGGEDKQTNQSINERHARVEGCMRCYKGLNKKLPSSGWRQKGLLDKL